jgi:hypothetical protein
MTNLFTRSILVAAALVSVAATVPAAASARRHSRCHRHCPRPVDKQPMSVPGSIAGGGQVTIQLRWISGPALDGLVGPRLLVESVSVSNVPATYGAVEGDELIQKPCGPLSGSQLFHQSTEVPGIPMYTSAPEHSVSLGIDVSEYEEDLHALHGYVFVGQDESASGLASCTANNYPADWEATLPHDWYGR